MYSNQSNMRKRGILQDTASSQSYNALLSQETQANQADDGVPPPIGNRTTTLLLSAFIYCVACVGILIIAGVIAMAVHTNNHHNYHNTPVTMIATTTSAIVATAEPPPAQTQAATLPSRTTTTTTTQPPATVGETPVHPVDISISSVCNVPFGNGTCRAVFSYENAQDYPVAIAVGENNHVSPGWQDRGQPQIFASGLRYGAVSFLWDCATNSHVHWTLRSGLSNALTMASASSYAVDCPALPINLHSL